MPTVSHWHLQVSRGFRVGDALLDLCAKERLPLGGSFQQKAVHWGEDAQAHAVFPGLCGAAIASACFFMHCGMPARLLVREQLLQCLLMPHKDGRDTLNISISHHPCYQSVAALSVACFVRCNLV